MSEEMVKKSVDVTPEDQEWIEEKPVNFSEWVRRKLAIERLHDLEQHKIDSLERHLEEIVQIGKQMRNQWEEQKETIKEEYDVQIPHQDRHTIGFVMAGNKYSTDWAAQEVHDYEGETIREGKPYEFAKEYTGAWQDTIGSCNQKIMEQTPFEVGYADDVGQNFEGKGLMDQFMLIMPYVCRKKKTITLRFEDRVTFDATQVVEGDF